MLRHDYPRNRIAQWLRCPHPLVAVYKEAGSTDAAESFVCDAAMYATPIGVASWCCSAPGRQSGCPTSVNPPHGDRFVASRDRRVSRAEPLARYV